MISSYKDLRVWQQGMKLAARVYRATDGFPKHELYGLTSQVRRAAVSVPSNIAEGKGHRSDREFLHFLFHARGSLLEGETQLILAEELKYLSKENLASLLSDAAVLGGALTGLINSLGESRGKSEDRRPTTEDQRRV